MYICSLDNKEDDYSLAIEQTKVWNEDAHGYNYGIQYDAYIYDNTDIDIKDWKSYITIPADCKLDSYWNGEFILKDGVLDNIENFEVHFYKSIGREEVSFLWVLVLLAILYIFIIITKTIIEIKTRKITDCKK